MVSSSRSTHQDEGVREAKLVEATNALSARVFFSRFFPKQIWGLLAGETDRNPGPQLVYTDAAGLSSTRLEQCLQLIEQSSAKDYQASEMKWSPAKKRKEMKLPDMKYIMFVGSSTRPDLEGKVTGFVSFMITYEDGHEVVYVYEIHLEPSLQGIGLGKSLMSLVESVGMNVGVEKSMLTVFRTNTRAIQWYERQGYTVDEFSPPPRKLRNGTVKESSYLILSKPLNGGPMLDALRRLSDLLNPTDTPP